MKAILTKVKWNKGTLDNGQAYDYTRVSLQLPVNPHATNEFGVDILDCDFGTSDKHVELLGFKGKLPCEVDLDMEQVMSKGKLVNVVKNIRPISSIRSTKPME